MAAVYESEQLSLGKKVALKVLASELASSTIVIERFFREARAAASVKSPYIVDVYDSGRLEDGRPFIAMELLEGESLYDRMARVRLIDPQTTIRIISHCCKGLAKAHAVGIVHRDLKPENIFLVKSEEGEEVAKILDFGLAKFYSPMNPEEKVKRLTREGAVFGTPAYMSPEQVKGLGNVDHRADLWALGCMAYECLTGRPVWNVDQGVAMTFAAIATAPLPDATKYRKDLPNRFTAWFQKALQRDPDDRFQSAKELAEGLADVWGEPRISNSGFTSDQHAARHTPSGQNMFSGNNTNPPIGGPFAPPHSAQQPRSLTPVPLQQPYMLPSSPGQSHPEQRPSPLSLSTQIEVPPAPQPASRLKLAVSALFLVASGAAAVMTYQQVLRPQLFTRVVVSTATATPSTQTTSTASRDSDPRWTTLIAEGQKLFTSGDIPASRVKFEEASRQGGAAVAKTYLEETGAPQKGPCRVVAFSRPRYGETVPAGRPAIVATQDGAIVAWSDDHEKKDRDHVYSVLIDTNGTPASKVHDLSPEAQYATRPALAANGDHAVVLYWDAKGREAGVRVRPLGRDGSVSGGHVLVGAAREGQFWPAIERAAQGFFVVWEDDRDKDGGTDLFARRLSFELETVGPETRLTDYVKQGKSTPRVHQPSVAVSANSLWVAYGLERDQSKLIYRLRANLTGGDLPKGLDEAASKKDREVGDIRLVNEDKTPGARPQMACGQEGCFIAWHTVEKKATNAALIDPNNGRVIWRRQISNAAQQPALAKNTDGRVMMAFFEDGQVKMTALTREGAGPISSFGKVTNMESHPRPSLAPGAMGEWWVSWEDTEGGRNEVNAARLKCGP